LLGVAVEDELIVDGLVDGLRILSPFGKDVGLGLVVQNIRLNLIARSDFEFFRVVQCNNLSPVFLKVEVYVRWGTNWKRD
jgi:hypothetical protein